MIDLKYPLLLVHGIGFRDSRVVCYWGRIPKALEAEGVKCFFGEQDSNGTVEDNGRFLAERIRTLAAEHDIPKFNVIAHSKGGLDMRYAISTMGIGDLVASLTTICTPHNGSYTVDKLMRAPKFLVKFVGWCSDLGLRIQGDKKPNAYEVYKSFTTGWAEEFNRANPDVPGIYYQSYSFTFSSMCSDMFLWFTHMVVKHVEGENDGLLTPRAVKWTNFQGVYTGTTNRGISHCDEVDMRRMRLTKKPSVPSDNKVSDMPDFYLDVVRGLAARGL